MDKVSQWYTAGIARDASNVIQKGVSALLNSQDPRKADGNKHKPPEDIAPKIGYQKNCRGNCYHYDCMSTCKDACVIGVAKLSADPPVGRVTAFSTKNSVTRAPLIFVVCPVCPSCSGADCNCEEKSNARINTEFFPLVGERFHSGFLAVANGGIPF